MAKIDKYKLFEYAYDELPENEMAEVEEVIAKDPEALKIVNEYLFLKQNLKELPVEAPEAIPEKAKDESSILGKLVASAGKYIVWDLRPNLAFAAFAIVLGVGIFQYNLSQNPYLNEREIAKIEQDFLLFKKGEIHSPWLDFNNKTLRSVVSNSNCKKFYYSKKNIILKICLEKNKYTIQEQTKVKK